MPAAYAQAHLILRFPEQHTVHLFEAAAGQSSDFLQPSFACSDFHLYRFLTEQDFGGRFRGSLPALCILLSHPAKQIQDVQTLLHLTHEQLRLIQYPFPE